MGSLLPQAEAEANRFLGGGGSLGPRMTFVLFIAMFSLGLLYWCLVRQKRRLEALRKKADAQRREIQSYA